MSPLSYTLILYLFTAYLFHNCLFIININNTYIKKILSAKLLIPVADKILYTIFLFILAFNLFFINNNIHPITILTIPKTIVSRIFAKLNIT